MNVEKNSVEVTLGCWLIQKERKRILVHLENLKNIVLTTSQHADNPVCRSLRGTGRSSRASRRVSSSLGATGDS